MGFALVRFEVSTLTTFESTLTQITEFCVFIIWNCPFTGKGQTTGDSILVKPDCIYLANEWHAESEFFFIMLWFPISLNCWITSASIQNFGQHKHTLCHFLETSEYSSQSNPELRLYWHPSLSVEHHSHTNGTDSILYGRLSSPP